MDLIEHFPPEILADIGRIGIHAGSVRSTLYCALNMFLCARVGDQGVGTLALGNEGDFQRLCASLRQIAIARGMARDATARIEAFAARYAEPMRLARAIGDGRWTYLGTGLGDGSPRYGLYCGTVLKGIDLKAEWHYLKPDDFRALVAELEGAAKDAKAVQYLAWVGNQAVATVKADAAAQE